MTREELAKELDISENYIKHHFKDIQDRLKRRGRRLVKIGRGSATQYGIIEEGQLEARF